MDHLHHNIPFQIVNRFFDFNKLTSDYIHFTFFNTPDGNNWIWGLRHGLFEVLKCNLSYVILYLLQKHFTNKRKGRPQQCYFFYLIVNSIVMLLRKLQILVRYILYPIVSYIFQAGRLSSTYLPTYILPYILQVRLSTYIFTFITKVAKFLKEFQEPYIFDDCKLCQSPLIKMEKKKVRRTFQVISLKRISKNALLSRRDLPCWLDYNTGCPKSKLFK